MATVTKSLVARSPPSLDSDSEDSDSLNVEGEEGWEDVEQETDDQQPIVSLFSDETFPSVMAMLEHCKQEHGFDFLRARQELGLDFYGLIKFVNYIRSEAKAGNKNPDITSAAFLEDDKYLHPVLEDDALLFSLDDLPDSPTPGGKISQVEGSLARVAELEEELQRLQSQFMDYRLAVKKSLDGRLNENDTPALAKSSVGLPVAVGGDSKEPVRDDDSHYFKSYSYNAIHETMLKDAVRTEAYRDFIYENKNIFANKVVLDVGCGTGILSMFCAKAGAKKVIAVDNSEIIDKAREIVFENGLGDVITCVRGKIEEVTLPVVQVDIIISEWMGYCLLYEAMLDSVIWARDHYLAPDGLMVPSHCTLYVAPISDPDYIADHISFWYSVYGFSMSSMLAGIHKEAGVRHLSPSAIIGSPSAFLQLPLHSITPGELTFDHSWESTITQDSDALDGFTIWFDTFFLPSRESTVPADANAETWDGDGVAFTTGAGGKETHWQQGLLLIDREGCVSGPKALKKGQKVRGRIGYKKQDSNSRELDIDVEWAVDGDGGALEHGKQQWIL
ncbi:hypothetical protein FGG08_005520 [Glutinoglossum americanum]|uniref:type I protein arginine methyltransferase n=1 Tax=Glutinoglossum americanum TaxID=1670608 RepID=A0A9P8HY09_9PEZI|nr:hypothetical protein FGG08_005520 [Glutinoglossum americanum]